MNKVKLEKFAKIPSAVLISVFVLGIIFDWIWMFFFVVVIPVGLIALDYVQIYQTKQWMKSPKVYATVKSSVKNWETCIIHTTYEYYDRTGIKSEYSEVTEEILNPGDTVVMIMWERKNGDISLISPDKLEGNLKENGKPGHTWGLWVFALLWVALCIFGVIMK